MNPDIIGYILHRELIYLKNHQTHKLMKKEMKNRRTLKWRILKAFSSIVVLLFGFSTTLMAQYGVVETEYIFKGEVLSANTGERIPGIKLNINRNNDRYYDGNNLDSSGDGTFQIYSFAYSGSSEMEITAEDVDGNANGGAFKPASVKVLPQSDEFTNSPNNQGHWHRYYEYSKKIIILMEEETPLIPVEPETPEPKDTVTISGALTEIIVIPDSMAGSNSVVTNTDEPQKAALIFPNPTKGSVSIEINPSEAQDIVIYLFDSRYRKLKELFVPASECAVRQELDLSPYASGTYYVKIQGKSFNASGKIVKN
jgi:putative lipoprotein (rSAM/lipoprotein system)